MGSGGLANEKSPGLPQSHVSQGLTHNHNQGSTLNTQLPLEVTGFGTGGTGLPVHHPSIYQSGTTMGSGGLANENSPGLSQSHVSQGLTHNHNQGSTLNTQLPLELTGFGTGGTGLLVHHPSIYQSGTTMGSGGLTNENSPGLPQSHVSQGLTHNHNQGSTLNTQLPLEVAGFGTGGTGLPVHHPSIYQSGTTMGSGGLANENSAGLPQSHFSQGLTHNHNQGSTLNTQLPFEVTGFGIGGTGLPVHHPPIYQSGTTMGSGGLANENSPGLPQSHVSQGLTHENNFEQPDATYGDQFIEFSGCSNNIDGSYI
ncbi:hypothetical protein OIU84_015833 [Salix udensis]|uniref:Uncharacterized protein n=1 Tax=Salix udensis TaxID=889485 RepID=A0AAD6J8W6_9ROSI|nr:hypothetical protein OIU84_015833 [Salix udensis]